jgi:hypothetical protein
MFSGCDGELHVNAYTAAINCTGAYKVASHAEDACMTTGMVSVEQSYGFQLSPPSATCSSGATVGPLPATSWNNPIAACTGASTTGGTCQDAVQACVPRPPSSVAASLCVYRTGEQTCPLGYSSRTVYYKAKNDKRYCSQSCTCAPNVGECTGTLIRHSMNDCSDTISSGASTAATIVDSAQTCIQNVKDASHWWNGYVLTDVKITPGSLKCTGVPVNVIDSATPADPITVCCTAVSP